MSNCCTKSVHRNSTSLLISLMLCLLVICASGCGPQRAAPVDIEIAKSTLIEVLETWQRGGTIQELKDRTPKIVVQEPLWTDQGRLVSYQLADDGRKEDANWFCEVELVIQNSDGSKKTHKVSYAVGTDPVLTVFHAIL